MAKTAPKQALSASALDRLVVKVTKAKKLLDEVVATLQLAERR